MWCQNKVYAFGTDDDFSQDIVLAPFQSFYFKENYEKGEPGTSIEAKSTNKPMMVMVLNQRDDTNNTYFVQENNQKDSQTSILTNWVNDAERKNFDQEKDNLHVQLTNLALSNVNVKINISRRSS